MGGLGDHIQRRPRGLGDFLEPGALRKYLEPGALDRLKPEELKALREAVAPRMPSVRDEVLRPRGLIDFVGPDAMGNRPFGRLASHQPSWREQIAQKLDDSFGTSRDTRPRSRPADISRDLRGQLPDFGDYLSKSAEALGRMPRDLAGMLADLRANPLDFLSQAGDGLAGIEIPFVGAGASLARASGLGAVPGLSRDARPIGAVLKEGAQEGERFAAKLFRETGSPKGPYEDLPRRHPARGVPPRTTDLIANRQVQSRTPATIQSSVNMGGHPATELFREAGPPKAPLMDIPRHHPARAMPSRTTDVIANPDGERLFKELFRELDPPNVRQFDLPRYDPPGGVPQRTQDLLANHQVWDKMGEMMLAGIAKGQHRWWNLEPLRFEFVNELGRNRGNRIFKQYTDFVSAASPMSEMGVSSRNGSYYLWLARDGKPIPPIGQNPFPYGHQAEWMHKLGVARVRAGTWDSTKTPKTPSMAQALQGNASPVPIDSKIFRGAAILSQDPRFLRANIRKMVESGQISMEAAIRDPTFWEAAPRRNEYAALERRLQNLAREAGVRPADGEGALWPELSDLTGMVSDPNKLGMDFILDRIVKTATQPIHRREKIRTELRDPKDVLRGFIHGEFPLIGLGSVALGAAALQDRKGAAKPKGTPARDAPRRQ